MPEMDIMTGRISMNRQDIAIRLWKCRNVPDEVTRVYRNAKDVINTGSTAAVLVPSHGMAEKFANKVLSLEEKSRWTKSYVQKGRFKEPDYDDMNAHLEENGIPIQYVANGFGDLSTEDRKIILITYHSAKGLDFDNVYMPSCNQSVYDGTMNNIFGKYVDGNELEALKRRLFMVAMTRSRRNLVMTYIDQANELIESFRSAKIGQSGRLLCNFHDYSNDSNQLELTFSSDDVKNNSSTNAESANPFF